MGDRWEVPIANMEGVPPVARCATNLKIHLRHYALNALTTAKEDLRRDGYLLPMTFVIAGDEILDFNLEFEDREQKLAVYAKVVETAKERSARAIITVRYMASSPVMAT
jgi:hypothetical protein